MATREELLNALRKADAAGDEPAARAIAQRIKALPAAKPATRAEAKAAGTPRKERTAGDYLGMAGRAVAGGVGDIVQMGLQMNPMSMLENFAPKQMQPYLPSGLAARAGDYVSDKLGLAKPETNTEKTLSSVGRGAVAAVIPGGGARLAAAKGATALAPVAASLGRGLIGQAASGGLSAGAGELVRQGGGGALEQGGASLLAGIAPTALASAGRNAIGGLAKHTILGDAEERAASTLKDALSNKDLVADALTQRPAPVPGVKPTTAEVALDPGMAALSRDRANSGLYARNAQNAQVRAGAAGNALGPGNAGNVSRLARREALKAEQAVAGATERVGPVAERVDTGEGFRTGFRKAYDATKAQVKEAYNSPSLKAEHPVEIEKPFKSAFFKHMDDYYGEAGGEAPAALRKIIGDMFDNMGPKAEKMVTNTRVVANLDRRLADFAGRSARSGANKEASMAQGLRDMLEKHVAHQMPDDVIADLAHAKGLRAEQGRIFEQNTLGRAMGRKKYVEDVTPNAEVGEAIVKRGPKGGTMADNVLAAVGKDASEPAIREQMRRLVDEGKVNLSKDVTGFEEVLKRYPGLKDDVDSLKESVALKEQFAKSNLGGLVDEGVGPVDHIGKLLAQKDDGTAIKGLINQVKGSGDKQAIKGLRRALGEYVKKQGGATRLDESGQAIPDTNASLKGIDSLLDKAGGALEPAQRKALEAIRKEMAGANYAGHAGVPGVDLPVNKAIPGVTGRVANTIRFLLGSFSNQKQVDNLIQKTLIDPDYALKLIRRRAPERAKRFGRTVGQAYVGTTAGAQQNEGL